MLSGPVVYKPVIYKQHGLQQQQEHLKVQPNSQIVPYRNFVDVNMAPEFELAPAVGRSANHSATAATKLIGQIQDAKGYHQHSKGYWHFGKPLVYPTRPLQKIFMLSSSEKALECCGSLLFKLSA
ncbi:unnamed protein product [Ceratitis capitata]|uniref:(Mediterranean fruit fly) hypothetical protein n=1 Tax=Ceratitis capitata TaxID=7213 RepID=A0A811VEZ0_CERCA|nr:unnamed protein product [Ceratitis capitata]